MLKKTVLGGLLIVLVGVLIPGTLNRTATRSAETSSNQHRPRKKSPWAAVRGS